MDTSKSRSGMSVVTSPKSRHPEEVQKEIDGLEKRLLQLGIVTCHRFKVDKGLQGAPRRR